MAWRDIEGTLRSRHSSILAKIVLRRAGRGSNVNLPDPLITPRNLLPHRGRRC